MNESLSDLTRFSRERLARLFARVWWAVLLSAVAAGVVAFIVSSILPPQFKASAQLYLAPSSASSVAFQDVVLGQNLARSYVHLAQAEVVLSQAMRSVNWAGTLDEFERRLDIVQIRDTSVLTISFIAGDPSLAADAANAIAESFIEQSRALQGTLQSTTLAQLEKQVASLQQEIRSAETEMAAIRAELARTPGPGSTADGSRATLNQLEAAQLARQQALAQLLKSRDDSRLALARAETTVSLWQPALPPAFPDSPRPLLNAIVASFMGGTLALLLVVVVAYMDDRLAELEEIPQRLGVPALAQVQLADRPTSPTGKLFVRDNPASSEAESFRTLRTNILFANVDQPPRSLLVTSALPSEGKSVVSANLALAFAELGKNVVLVDCDLRRPSQHRLFRLSARSGLTGLLASTAPAIDFAQFQVGTNLFVIPSGPLPPNPAELLASDKMVQLVGQFMRLAVGGQVILDTSPVLPVSDPRSLASKVDGCVFVVDSARTSTRAARHAVEALMRVQGKVLGVVLNKVEITPSYYGRYGQYGYGPQQRAGSADRR